MVSIMKVLYFCDSNYKGLFFGNVLYTTKCLWELRSFLWVVQSFVTDLSLSSSFAIGCGDWIVVLWFWSDFGVGFFFRVRSVWVEVLFWVVLMAETGKPLLKTVYYENCPGCKQDQINEMRRGIPIKEFLFIWIVTLCTSKRLPSFLGWFYHLFDYLGFISAVFVIGNAWHAMWNVPNFACKKKKEGRNVPNFVLAKRV